MSSDGMREDASSAMADRKGYSLPQIALHWTIAALVLVQLLFNEGMQEAWDAREDGERAAAADEAGATVHIVVGATILALAAIRLVVRLTRGAPPVPRQHPLPLRVIASATHVALYGFILLQPLTGATAWFLGIEEAAEIHELGPFIILPLVTLHAAGALAEHFVFRTDVLKRMLKPERS
jgi:cytochrome b561